MNNVNKKDGIPSQKPVSWAIAFGVSWSSLCRRFLRAMITMLGVILAIAFLTYMLVNDSIIQSLMDQHNDALNVLLQRNGVDVVAGRSSDTMMLLLIGLSLLTCLVGIVNAMLMAVTERIKEIGTLKCLGALDGFIVKTYFIESSLQGVIGTLFGIILGLVVNIIVAIISYKGYVFNNFPWFNVIRSLTGALLIGSFISVLAAIAPAYWASRKQPVDAMRVEE